MIYENTLQKMEEELRKRTKPQAVYFSPSSDIFRPVPEVLELCHSILELLFRKDIGVAFVSKGCIPEKTMNLLIRYADKVRAQIGITTLNDNIRRIFEPNAAGTQKRLEQMTRMVAGGITTEARIIPILPGCTDDPTDLTQLFQAISNTRVKHAAISALFLRPVITASIKSGISNEQILKNLFDQYRGALRITVKAEDSSIMPLPLSKKRSTLQSCQKK